MTIDYLLDSIPHLRRHARLALSSQLDAENLVEMSLELLLAEPDRFDERSTNAAVFKAFHDCWYRFQTRTDPQYSNNNFEVALQRLTRQEREIVLLMSSGLLNASEVAAIADVEPRQLRQIYFNALSQCAHRHAMIIDECDIHRQNLCLITKEVGIDIPHFISSMDGVFESARKILPSLILTSVHSSDDTPILEQISNFRAAWRAPAVIVLENEAYYPDQKLIGDQVLVKSNSHFAVKSAVLQALSNNTA